MAAIVQLKRIPKSPAQWAGTGDHGEIGPFKYFGSNLQLFPDIKSPKSNFKMVFGHPKLLNQKLLGVFGS